MLILGSDPESYSTAGETPLLAPVPCIGREDFVIASLLKASSREVHCLTRSTTFLLILRSNSCYYYPPHLLETAHLGILFCHIGSKKLASRISSSQGSVYRIATDLCSILANYPVTSRSLSLSQFIIFLLPLSYPSTTALTIFLSFSVSPITKSTLP